MYRGKQIGMFLVIHTAPTFPDAYFKNDQRRLITNDQDTNNYKDFGMNPVDIG